MRFRYRLRIAMPLKGNTIDDNEFYLHAFDELLIGAGEKIKNNIFDQNRLNIGLGYKLNKHCKFELGYINQIVMKSASHPISNLPILESNNGFLLGVTYNFDFTTTHKKVEDKQP